VKRARAHHYLPIFYLNGFTSALTRDKGFLWVYEREKSVRRSKPVNEGHERDLYAYQDEDGTVLNIEQLLSVIESQLASLFQAISEGHHQFGSDDWQSLTIFMALMWVGGPMGRDLVNKLSADAMRAIMRKLANEQEAFESKYWSFLESAKNR
jgi:hypothetical protein